MGPQTPSTRHIVVSAACCRCCVCCAVRDHGVPQLPDSMQMSELCKGGVIVYHCLPLYAPLPQIQACLVLCVGVVGWTLSGLRRRRELLRLQAAGHGAFLQQRAGMADSHPAAAGCAGQAPEGHCSSRQHESKAAVLQQRRSCCQPAAVSAASASASAQEAEAAGVAGGCTRAAPCSHDTQQQSCTPALFKSLRNADSNSSSTNSGSSSCPWPPLAVVLPVKGCRPHSTDNWASQLDALYGTLPCCDRAPCLLHSVQPRCIARPSVHCQPQQHSRQNALSAAVCCATEAYMPLPF